MNKMKPLHTLYHRDGGTEEYSFLDRTFCLDHRLGTNTKGDWYEGYPKKDNSNRITDGFLLGALEIAYKNMKGEEECIPCDLTQYPTTPSECFQKKDYAIDPNDLREELVDSEDIAFINSKKKVDNSPLDSITLDSVQDCLKLLGFDVDNKIVDACIDVIELLLQNGGDVSLKAIQALREEYKEGDDLEEIIKFTTHNTTFVEKDSNCLHNSCIKCNGTGLDIYGGLCLHSISCSCSKCSLH